MEETYHRNGLSRNENRNEKRVVLLGDSYELWNQVEKGRIYVKSYSGSKISTNDLPTRKNSDKIAKSIAQLTSELKTKVISEK